MIASRVPPSGDLARNPGRYPDWEWNQRPFGSQASTQSIEPHQPGPTLFHYNVYERENGLYSTCTFSPCPCGFCPAPGFLPHPNDVHVGRPGVSASPSPNECGVCQRPCDRRASCPGVAPALCPELLGLAPTTHDSERE